MKTLLIALLTYATLQASAFSITTCTTHTGPRGHITVKMTQLSGFDVYHIEYFGSERNSHAASYVQDSGGPTRIGFISKLKKIHDSSTWKDMPQFLNIKSILQGNDVSFDVLEGLPYPAQFTDSDCINQAK